MRFLGIDTSNYTTSAALTDGAAGEHVRRLLDVPEGALGLRQSDALFQHVKRLPGLLDRLLPDGKGREIAAVGASCRPRRAEGSYMPCFLAGETVGQAMAAALGVPFYRLSHQEGHLAAAAWSAGRGDLPERPFLAWHLSGGTTELLHVTPHEDGGVRAERIGGSDDLSAGQLVDRTGKLLGLAFPAGQALDGLAGRHEQDVYFTVKIREFSFSLSGAENQVRALAERGTSPEDTAYFALRGVAAAAERVTESALKRYPGLPVLFSGGVSGSRVLRERLERLPGAVFGTPEFSGDNAMGAALLAGRLYRRERGAEK